MNIAISNIFLKLQISIVIYWRSFSSLVLDSDLPELQCFNETLCFCPKGYEVNFGSCRNKQDTVLTTKGLSGSKSKYIISILI